MIKIMRYLPWISPFYFVFGTISPLLAQVSIGGVGYTTPAPPIVAPGEVTTLFISGLQSYIPTPLVATATPLPTTLGGISVSFQENSQSYAAPLFRIQQTSSCVDATDTSAACLVTAITIQVPFEIVPSGLGVPLSATISENGTVSKAFALQAMANHMHVLTTCDSVFGTPPAGQECDPIVTHADFTPVSVSMGSAGSAAAAGEVVVIWAVGLGFGPTLVSTGQATPPYVPVPTSSGGGGLVVDFEFYENAAPSRPPTLNSISNQTAPGTTFVGLTPGYVGLYQIAVAIPTPPVGVRPCDFGVNVHSNLTINLIAGNYGSWDGAPICVNIPQ